MSALTHIAAVAAVVTLTAASHAAPSGLFSAPGDTVLAPVDIEIDPIADTFLGQDAAGYVYVRHAPQVGAESLVCYDPDAPDATRRAVAGGGVLIFSADRTTVDRVTTSPTRVNGLPTAEALRIVRVTCADLAGAPGEFEACPNGETCLSGVCPASPNVVGVGICLREDFSDAQCAAAGGDAVPDAFCFPFQVETRVGCATGLDDACSPSGFVRADAACGSGFACFTTNEREGTRCAATCGPTPVTILTLAPDASPLMGGETCGPLACGPAIDPEGALLPDGRYCFAVAGETRRGIVCIDPKTSPPSFSELLDLATLEASLAINPSDAVVATGYLDVLGLSDWTFRAPLATPDGRVFFFASRSWQTSGTSPIGYGVRVLGERLPDGTVRPRFGPIGGRTGGPDLGPEWSAWGDPMKLLYSPKLDAVLAWPIQRQEVNTASDPELYPELWGAGFRVFPLAGPGVGYLSMTAPLARLQPCRNDQFTLMPGICGDELDKRAPDAFVLASGDLALLTRAYVAPAALYEVGFRAAEVDLDDDQLGAGEEDAHGSSDYLRDSDFGARSDGAEVHLTKGDPADPDDDGGPLHYEGVRGGLAYTTSTLFRANLPALAPYMLDVAATAGASGPLCVAGACYGPDGAIVMRYPNGEQTFDTRAVTSADGTFLALWTANGLERFFFADGRRDLYIPMADIQDEVPVEFPYHLQVIPVDAGLTWLVRDGAWGPAEPADVVVARAGEPLRTIYDHAQAQRESGLEVATSNRLQRLTEAVSSVIELGGYNAQLGMLEFGVRGSWDTWLIGLTPDGTASVLERGRRLAGLDRLGRAHPYPTSLPPALPGWFLPTGHGDYFTTRGVLDPFGDGYDTNVYAYHGAFSLPPFTVWGDTLMYAMSFDGLYELVRGDFSLHPGDVLVMLESTDGHDDGTMLYKSGPRGGLTPVWPAKDTLLEEVSGMDWAPDGSRRLCVADSGAEAVWELRADGPEVAPYVLDNATDVVGVVDCAYTEDGALHVLALGSADGPPRILVRATRYGDLGLERELGAADHPLALVAGPDGSMEVANERTLRVVRPDGRVITADYDGDTRTVHDPISGSDVDLDILNLRTRGMVIVPGGSAADPWTGRVRGPAVEVPDGVDVPVAPEAPSGGVRIADEGCAGAGGGGIVTLFALALRIRRRRAPRPRL